MASFCIIIDGIDCLCEFSPGVKCTVSHRIGPQMRWPSLNAESLDLKIISSKRTKRSCTCVRPIDFRNSIPIEMSDLGGGVIRLNSTTSSGR